MDASVSTSTTDPPFGAPPAPRTVHVVIVLPGEPQGKSRARAFRRGPIIGHYTPKKTRLYESAIRVAAMQAMGARMPIEGAVRLELEALCPVPRSWTQRRREAALAGAIRPTSRPDLDNISKAWLDGLNGIAYRDDAQIVEIRALKRFSVTPQVIATVKVMDPHPRSDSTLSAGESVDGAAHGERDRSRTRQESILGRCA